MNTEMEDRLAERMQRLADELPDPVGTAEDDLVRGRRRLRRNRGAAVAGVLAVGVMTVGAGYLAHSTGPGRSVAAPSTSGRATDTNPPLHNGAGVKKRTAKASLDGSWKKDPRLQGMRAAIAAALDPKGRHLDATLTNEQSGDGVLGTKLGWKDGPGLAEIEVSVARPQADGTSYSPHFEPLACAPAPEHPCRDVRLPDGTTGKQQHRGNELGVYYTRPDGQVVLIIESTLFGNNSTVPADTLPATATQLLRAASDPRMSLDR